MKVEIKEGDQLYVNNKWYFDVTDINGNIIQVRIQYKENINSDKYFYKIINIDEDLITNIEDGNIKKCTIDEYKLKKEIGNLIKRIKTEMDYSFIYMNEEVNVANTAGMGDVVSGGISDTVGEMGTAGSADISINKVTPELGEPFDKHKKRKKEKITLRSPILDLSKNESIKNDSDIKSVIIDIVNYPEFNSLDVPFIEEILSKKDDLINMSKDTIHQYINDLVTLNKNRYEMTSSWFQEKINTILDA